MAFVGISGKGVQGGPLRSERHFNDEFDGKGGCGCIQIRQPKKPDKLTKIQLLKERIRQFSIWYFEEQEHIDKDLFRRRVERKRVKTRHVSTKVLRTMKCLYAIDVIIWMIGLTFLLCSTVKSFGKYTPFYEHKHMYQILGPVVLLCAVLLLLFITGCKHRVRTKHNKPRGNFYIINKKRQCTCNSSVQSSIDTTKDVSEDSGNEADIDDKTEKKSARHKMPRDDNKVSVTKSKSPPMYFYKNVDSRQCSFELSPIASSSGMSAHVLSEKEREAITKRSKSDRRAWTKSKWMRVESEDSFDTDLILEVRDDFVDTPDDGTGQHDGGDEGFAQFRRNRFQTRTQNTSSYDSDDIYHPLARNISTKSKVSQASTISTCSETAPLVKR